jgi:hypothetical protein
MSESTARPTTAATAPYSALIRKAAGVCLVLAALTNGLSQYVGYLVIGDLEFVDQVRWGAEHLAFQRAEQMALVVSALFMLPGLLAVAQVTRWSSRRLTLTATALVVWGMWGFHNILAIGYIMGTAAPQIIGLDAALVLNEKAVSDPGAALLGLLPHLVGSFLGLILLSVAAWRSGAFSKTSCVLVVVFLLWDYLLAPVGPLEAHLVLLVAWTWWGVTLVRMPQQVWCGAAVRRDRASADDAVVPAAY